MHCLLQSNIDGSKVQPVSGENIGQASGTLSDENSGCGNHKFIALKAIK